MTYIAVPPRASFWRETLLALKRTLKAEWHWVLGFAVFMGVAQFLVFRRFDLDALLSQFKDDPKAMAQNAQVMGKIWGHLGREFVVQTGGSVFASYVFTVLYLRREATSSPPSFTMDGFLFWLGKSCQKYSILF
ncbi:MAG: hypothetical protein WCD70_07775, partial [Alphaproteobacteria bacterium]